MGNFDKKLMKFWEIFYTNKGYTKVLIGLRNTLCIATLGLFIGIVIGTIIAGIKVMPKYKKLPKILEKICDFYVGLFRGTPVVVQLLVAYFVVLPLIGIKLTPLTVCILVFGLNSGAYVSEIMRSGIMSV
ncbi:MAG TPA: ABC transporter permease subunit, partial [Acetivibrio clariflavus]|nr:ABC transporter permease subunit [Acetivibrio clariflavus]